MGYHIAVPFFHYENEIFKVTYQKCQGHKRQRKRLCKHPRLKRHDNQMQDPRLEPVMEKEELLPGLY